MELEYKLITNKSDLMKYRNGISELFLHCFKREMDDEQWEWQYLNNPVGDAVVSLCFDGAQLVGQYAAIQMPVTMKQHPERALLSVGSMVHSLYRKYGVFVKQGEEVYDYAKDDYLCVLGFPNKMALPARKKRLNWSVHENDYVALVGKKELAEADDFNEFVNADHDIKLDMENESYLDWRLSKPGVKYVCRESSIVKGYEGNYDLVFIDKGYLGELEGGLKYHVLCDSSIDSLRKYKIFEYPFGYYFFRKGLTVGDFKKDLIMSDVF